MPNYDSSEVGVAYVRVDRVEITYPAPLTAEVTFHQSLATKMKDGSIKKLEPLETLRFTLTAADMMTPYPIPHPDTGQPTGQTGTPMQCYLLMLGMIRKKQLEVAALQSPPLPQE